MLSHGGCFHAVRSASPGATPECRFTTFAYDLRPEPAVPQASSPFVSAADADGDRAVRPVELRSRHLLEFGGRQGRDHRARSAARLLRSLADALRLGSA